MAWRHWTACIWGWTYTYIYIKWKNEFSNIPTYELTSPEKTNLYSHNSSLHSLWIESENVWKCLCFVQQNVTPLFKSHRCGPSLCFTDKTHAPFIRRKTKNKFKRRHFEAEWVIIWQINYFIGLQLLHKINLKSTRCVRGVDLTYRSWKHRRWWAEWQPGFTLISDWRERTCVRAERDASPFVDSVINARPAAGPWKWSHLLAAVRLMRATHDAVKRDVRSVGASLVTEDKEWIIMKTP